jgi:hypothetical protein
MMLLEPGMSLDKEALKNAADSFNYTANLDILNPKSKVRPGLTTAGLLRSFEQILRYRSQKFSSVSGSQSTAPLEGSIVKRGAFMAMISNSDERSYRSHFGNDVVIWREPPSIVGLFSQPFLAQVSNMHVLKRYSSRRGLATRVHSACTLCLDLTTLFVPILLTYFIYLAVRLHQPTLYILSWTLVSIFLVFSIWGDEQMKFRQKAVFTILTPINQGFFYALSFVRSAAVLTGLVTRNKLQRGS